MQSQQDSVNQEGAAKPETANIVSQMRSIDIKDKDYHEPKAEKKLRSIPISVEKAEHKGKILAAM